MIKPMKAPCTSLNLSQARYPYLASFKYDGVRALTVDGAVYSNTCKQIPNKHVQELFSEAKLNGLDGELIVGDPTAPDCFRRTMSGVMSSDGVPEVRFFVFDALRVNTATCEADLKEGYAARYKRAQELVRSLKKETPKTKVVLVEHRLVRNEAELLAMEAEALSLGYEGLMLRSLDGIYKQGPNRATVREGYLLKLKRFEDSEAIITGVEEAMHNTNEAVRNELGRNKRSSHKEGMVGAGMVGTLIGKDVKTGQEVRIGAGKMTHIERKYWWDHRQDIVSKIVVYKFFPTGSKDLPRHPTFKGFRDPRDMS